MSMWTEHEMHSVGKRLRTRATHSPLKWIPLTAARMSKNGRKCACICVSCGPLCAPYKTGHRMELKETANGRYRHDDTNDNEPMWLRYATHWRWHLATCYVSRRVRKHRNTLLKFLVTIMILVKINAAFNGLHNFHDHNFLSLRMMQRKIAKSIIEYFSEFIATILSSRLKELSIRIRMHCHDHSVSRHLITKPSYISLLCVFYPPAHIFLPTSAINWCAI